MLHLVDEEKPKETAPESEVGWMLEDDLKTNKAFDSKVNHGEKVGISSWGTHKFWSLLGKKDEVHNLDCSDLFWKEHDLAMKIREDDLTPNDLLTKHNEKLQDFHFVFIRGLFTKWYGAAYFRDNLEIMEKFGCSCEMLPIDSDMDCDTNAEVICDYLKKRAEDEPDKKLVVVSHSKGAVDMLHALAMLKPKHTDAIQMIRLWITLQGPVGGSALAHDVFQLPTTNAIATRFITKMLGGDANAVLDLTYEKRKAWWVEKGGVALYEDIPTVLCLGTTLDSNARSTLKTAIRYTHQRHQQSSDGLVAARDAVLPNANFVVIHGMDHTSAAFENFPNLRYVCNRF